MRDDVCWLLVILFWFFFLVFCMRRYSQMSTTPKDMWLNWDEEELPDWAAVAAVKLGLREEE